MPAHKNQHFVPRCHLRPFSLNGAGAAINLFNISRQSAIPNAPLKNQCARDYLHGKGATEGALAKVEGRYSRLLALLDGGSLLENDDYDELRFFMFLQSMRTESVVESARSAAQGLNDVIYERSPELKPIEDRPVSVWMMHSLHVCTSSTEFVEDLKVVIVRNLTDRDFVTSDNPAFLTNRYHLQKLAKHSFGYIHAGAILAMPLTTRLYAVCYDGRVYTVPRATGKSFVEIDKAGDVHALNELQYLSAAENIYFRKWEEREAIGREIAGVAGERAKASVQYFTFVRDAASDKGPGEEAYRQGTREEELTARETISGFEVANRSPSQWPSFMKYRPKPRQFSNGTAVGLVRHPEWLKSSR